MATKTSEHRITDQLTTMAHEAIDRVAEPAGQAEEVVREQMAGADEDVQERLRQGLAQRDALIDSVGDYVKEHPVAAVAWAFSAGALLAALMKRS